MRSKEDIQNGIAEALHALRTKYGYSKTKMAELVGVDKHTWIRWESGTNSPTISEFFLIYEKLGEPAISPVLDMAYAGSDSDLNRKRRDIAEYFLINATEHQLRACAFLINGTHGSDVKAQVEEFCAINHLPVQYRYFIAEQVYVYYMLARQRGELILPNEVMPNMESFTFGLKSIQKAAFDKLKIEKE